MKSLIQHTFLNSQISAKDADYGDYGALTYDVLSDMAKEVFAVDGDTGQITTKVRLDREMKSVRSGTIFEDYVTWPLRWNE